MRILVCVKEVPDTNEIKIDPIKNTLIRSGVPNILNPYDGYALEKALELKDKIENINITVLTMGPKNTSEMLRSLLAVGADKAYLLTDRKFSGSDTLATSHIISESIKVIEEKDGKFDLILCGKQAIDGETAQVGPEIAQKLDLPQVTYVKKIRKIDNNIIEVIKEIDDGELVIEAKLPTLLTITKSKDLRFPTIKGVMKSLKQEIEVLTINDVININKNIIGLKGSPTIVSKMFRPKLNKETKFFNVQDNFSIKELVLLLEKENILSFGKE